MTFNFYQAACFIRHFFVAKRKGHGVHSPFAFRLCENVFYDNNSFYQFNNLSKIRRELQRNKTTIHVNDLGAGSKLLRKKKRKISHIATVGISSRRQSELLYKLINFLNCNTCIELGTSLGLNTLYLASASSRVNVTSIEGDKQLHTFAKNLAKKYGCYNIEFINNSFDKVLQTALSKATGIDFIYFDGNHTFDATLNYFNCALPYAHNDTVFVFDDIYWSSEMTRAWEVIKAHYTVTMSIDFFHFGLIFFKKEIKAKTELLLYL